jgi:hypothetical protein
MMDSTVAIDGNQEAARPLGLGRFEWALLVLIAILLVSHLLVPPIVGLADNGDYVRITDALGLRPVAETWGDKYFLYVNQTYRIVPRTAPLTFSSELLLGETALAVDRIMTHDQIFDLRFLGTLHLLLYLLGLSLILSAMRTFKGPVRVALGLGLLVSSTDVAYVATMNSFYTESASLIFLTLVLGLALREARSLQPSWRRTAFYYAAAAVLVCAKPQNLILVLPLTLWPIALLRRRPRLRPAGLVVFLSVTLCLWSGILMRQVPPSYRMPVVWDTLFYSILPHSPSPEEDLKEFGLEPELARYSGTNSCDDGVPFRETASRYGYRDIARFYLRHPGRFLGLSALCAGQAFTWREPLLGNFTKASGQPPRRMSRRISGWSEFEGQFLPKSIWFLGAVFLLLLAGCVREGLRHGLSTRTGATALLVAGAVILGVCEFTVCVALEGPKDLTKHLYLFQVLFDVCFWSGLAYVIGRLSRALPWGWWRSASVGREEGASTTPGRG